ncbi:MAG: hypothetical protein DRP70_01925 [Spirochaetes bacterium]|nr:MAG: hypothetical protein DRP70_01925 [Spirochaetota bacterium]
MIFARKFTLAEDDDYERIVAAGGRLRALLEAFTVGQLPREYGLMQLAGYARSLLAVQRVDGSFSSYAHPEKLEIDVRTDAHRFVTWAALAFLCRFEDTWKKTGEKAGEINLSDKELDEGISAVFRCPVVSDFTFPESGEAEPVQQVEAVLILSSGGIPGRLSADPSAAPELKAGLDVLKADFRHRLETGNTSLPGGIEYADLFHQAQEGLEH